MGKVVHGILSLRRVGGGSGGGSGGGRIRMDSYGRMVVRVTRNSLRWGVGSGMSKVLSSQLGGAVQCMRVRRGCVVSASEWCVGVRYVVQWGIGVGCMSLRQMPQTRCPPEHSERNRSGTTHEGPHEVAEEAVAVGVLGPVEEGKQMHSLPQQ